MYNVPGLGEWPFFAELALRFLTVASEWDLSFTALLKWQKRFLSVQTHFISLFKD